MDLKESIYKFKAENDAIEGIRSLEGLRPERVSKPVLTGLVNGLSFVTVEGIGSFWDSEHPDKVFGELLHRMTGFLVGMASLGSDLVYMMRVSNLELGLYLGSPKIEILRQLMIAQIPGCRIKDVPASVILSTMQSLPSYSSLVGNPAPPQSYSLQNSLPSEKIDQIVRGFGFKKSWALFVIAQPFSANDNRLLVHKWGTLSRMARQNFRQTESGRTADRLGEHYVDLLENQFQRAMEGQGAGNWQVQVYLLDTDNETSSIAASVFCDSNAQPEVVRCLPATENSSWGWHSESSTWINSRELAYWIELPLNEYPGYQVQSYARFDVALPEGYPLSGISLGKIQDINNPTGQTLYADSDELTGHALIAGTTNSGKTNTTFHLLDELATLGYPFLVIEPTKGEYRFLREKYPQLQLYTMGSPEFPLRINPFYVPGGVPVQMHLDYLLSLFSASFVLYAPMPYVLESALHEIYADRGWDLINDICIRDMVGDQNERNPRSFPTLTDLLHKIDDVTERLGYDDRISADVKAALQARVNSLRMGNKGTMLDTQEPFGFDELMKTPTLIEMGSIGDDEQKAFLIGLLLTRLFEQNIRAGIQVGKSRLRHITVIEEAHRLLQNAQPGNGGDFANPRGKAVETFSNLITEIRAYGEGFIIVEQSPVKLAPDVVKNTNFKVIHRIISADDSQALAQVMNLDEKMQRVLVGIPKGYAVVFAGGMDRPMMVRFEDRKKGLDQFSRGVRLNNSPKDSLIPATRQLAEEHRIQLEFARWFLNIVTIGSLVPNENWDRLRGALSASFPLALKDNYLQQKMFESVIPSLATWLASELGRIYLWPFDQEEKLQLDILALWKQKALPRTVQEAFYAQTGVGISPFPACQICSEPCRYRFFVNLNLRGGNMVSDLENFQKKYIQKPSPETLQDFYGNLRYLSARLVETDSPSFHNLLICHFSQACHRLGLQGMVLQKLINDLKQIMLS